MYKHREIIYLKYLKRLLKCVHPYHFDFQMQDPYPPISKNRQTSAPAATRAGSRPSSKYGSQPGSTKEDRGGLSVTSSRLVSYYRLADLWSSEELQIVFRILHIFTVSM